jgi:hypothetical protein
LERLRKGSFVNDGIITASFNHQNQYVHEAFNASEQAMLFGTSF